jgi:hypothetical protein
LTQLASSGNEPPEDAAAFDLAKRSLEDAIRLVAGASVSGGTAPMPSGWLKVRASIAGWRTAVSVEDAARPVGGESRVKGSGRRMEGRACGRREEGPAAVVARSGPVELRVGSRWGIGRKLQPVFQRCAPGIQEL